jgi:hypothetical protein
LRTRRTCTTSAASAVNPAPQQPDTHSTFHLRGGSHEAIKPSAGAAAERAAVLSG